MPAVYTCDVTNLNQLYFLRNSLGEVECDAKQKEEYFSLGKDEMEQNFGVRARQYSIYGHLLHHLSVICLNHSHGTIGSVCQKEGVDGNDKEWRNRNLIESLRRTRPDSKNSRDISCLTSALSFGILD